MFEGSTDEYDKLKRQYQEYLDLYRLLNEGSTEGATPFDVFYWRFTYYLRYEDPSQVRSDRG